MSQYKHRQLGFNLIELMVSVAISMAVLAGVAKMFMGQNSAAKTQDAASQVQETARLVFHSIGDQVKQAGYFPLAVNKKAVSDYSDNDYLGMTGINPVTVTNLGLRDTLTLVHVTRDTYVAATGVGGDCTGAAPVPSAEGNRLVASYSVNAANELICTNPAGQSTVLASGVLQFNIRFGVSGSAQWSDDSATSYIDASAFTTAIAPTIRSVEVCVVIQSTVRGGDANASNDQYRGCDGIAVNAPKDGFYRQTFRQVMTIRNSVLNGV